MGVAPALSAEGAHVSARMIADRATVIALIAGVVALAVAYLRDVRTKMSGQAGSSAGRAPTPGPGPGAPAAAEAVSTGHGPANRGATATLAAAPASETVTADSGRPSSKALIVAVCVPALFGALLVFMLLGRFTSLIPDIDEGLGAPWLAAPPRSRWWQSP